ncbi:nicotinate-nucleotide--dimethylbenzimidazole phosphoribosyltransferase [Rahnella selenatireducens]|uniref:nicotinate-nucleotide--dimethylbenzimidazole phosphoribosyltransferase n=1 Tax=Rahnella selenatireducens TaxID=3389797 RepID=UPI003968EF7D
MASLANIIRQIAKPDAEAARAAAERLDSLVKPLGSLGRLEQLAVQLASIRGKAPLKFPSKEILVMAADHGVWHEGVTPSPQVVTAIQAVNIVQGKAGVSVLARNAGAQVTLVDCGILGPDIPGTLNHKVAQGTGNIVTSPAMTREQAESLLVWSAERVIAKAESGLSLLAVGELGMANTTPAAAMVAVLTGAAPAQTVGLGANLPPERLTHKISVVEKALAVNQPDASDALDVMAKVGGFELVGMAGAMIGAAAAGIPVVLDGFLSYASALAACQMAPALKPYLIPSHLSAEQGATIALEALGLQPYFDLSLRLGEGSGAALALPLIDAACAIHNEMATLAECQITL